LDDIPQLPYRAPSGQWRPGVYFLHAIRVTDRFWSKGFMELAMDPQRAINQHVTRIEQAIERSATVRWVEEGSVKKLPDGSAGSVGWLKPGKAPPQTDQGVGPGPWIKAAIDMQRENLARAVLPEAALGENPENVTTYSQLALLHDQARKRLSEIADTDIRVVGHLSEDSAWDIKTKWGPDREIKIAGVEGQLRAARFNASVWPDYYKMMFSKGGRVRTPGAELKLIEDTWNAAVQSGAVLVDPNGWLTWRVKSTEGGKMLDLPAPPTDADQDRAQYENELMLQNPDVQFAVGLVDYYDQHALHVKEHRVVQSHARLMGRNDVFIAIESHCKEHERQQLLTAMQSIGTPGPTMPTGNPNLGIAAPLGNGAAGGSPPAEKGNPSAPKPINPAPPSPGPPPT
jgi:hypothetical protein